MPKFVIRADRFIDGYYYKASPDNPVIVFIPDVYFQEDHHKTLDGLKEQGLEPYQEGVAPEAIELKKHFHVADAAGPMTSAERFSKPIEQTKPVDMTDMSEAQAAEAPKKTRASDKKPI